MWNTAAVSGGWPRDGTGFDTARSYYRYGYTQDILCPYDQARRTVSKRPASSSFKSIVGLRAAMLELAKDLGDRLGAEGRDLAFKLATRTMMGANLTEEARQQVFGGDKGRFSEPNRRSNRVRCGVGQDDGRAEDVRHAVALATSETARRSLLRPQCPDHIHP